MYLTLSNQIRKGKYKEKVKRLDVCDQHRKEKETQEQRDKRFEKLREDTRLRRINEGLELRSLKIARENEPESKV